MSGHNRFNPTALRKAKIAYNFGLSECNRDKEGPFVENYHQKPALSPSLVISLFTECTFTEYHTDFMESYRTMVQGCFSASQRQRNKQSLKNLQAVISIRVDIIHMQD